MIWTSTRLFHQKLCKWKEKRLVTLGFVDGRLDEPTNIYYIHILRSNTKRFLISLWRILRTCKRPRLINPQQNVTTSQWFWKLLTFIWLCILITGKQHSGKRNGNAQTTQNTIFDILMTDCEIVMI